MNTLDFLNLKRVQSNDDIIMLKQIRYHYLCISYVFFCLMTFYVSFKTICEFLHLGVKIICDLMIGLRRNLLRIIIIGIELRNCQFRLNLIKIFFVR